MPIEVDPGGKRWGGGQGVSTFWFLSLSASHAQPCSWRSNSCHFPETVWIPSCLGWSEGPLELLAPVSTLIWGGDTTHGCIYPSPRQRSQDAGCRLACQSFPTGQDCTYLAGDTQEIDSRMGSRMSKLKEISEDMQSSNSQFIFNLKTLSSKGKFMQSPSLYIDKS